MGGGSRQEEPHHGKASSWHVAVSMNKSGVLSVGVLISRAILFGVYVRAPNFFWTRQTQPSIWQRYGEIGDWDVSDVTSMHALFADLTTIDEDISRWNTSAVTDMSCMFQGAAAFNQPIGSWSPNCN